MSQVATNSLIGSGYDTTNNYFMSRTLHVATDTITQLRLVFANWSLAPAGDVAGGTTATYTASIEYPVGTFTQVTFGGSVSGTAASGNYLVSDITTVSIPQGAQFFVRNYRVHAAGAFYAPIAGNATTYLQAAGDAGTFGSNGVSVTDKTMGGTVANTSGTTAAPPAAILAVTSKHSVFQIGDSRSVRGGSPLSTSTSTNPGTGELLPSFFAAPVAYIGSGVGGDKAMNWAAGAHSMSARLAVLCTAVVSNHSINDIIGGRTSAQLIADHQTIEGLFLGKPYYVATIAPYTTSTDSWATTTNQTVHSVESQRIAFNAAVRSGGVPGVAGYYDLASVVESSLNSGFWIVNGAANYATNDGTHETTAGVALILSSGVVTAP